MPKRFGGSGVPNLEMRNNCLFLRWWWKATTQTDGLWYPVIQILRKHRPHQSDPKTWMVNGSFFWNQLIKFHILFQWCTQWIIGNGAKISYWYDCSGPTPLRRMKDGGPRPISQHILLQEAFQMVPLLSLLLLIQYRY